MALELAKPGVEWFYSDTDRRHLLQWGTPPPDTTIWMGRYVNSHSLFTQGQKLSNPKAQSLLAEGHSTVLAFGRVVIQVASVRSKSTTTASVHLTPMVTENLPWGRLLLQIWPITEDVIRWPPALSFTDSEYRINALIRRFSPQR